jgi:L-fucose mutarotase
VRMPGCVTRSQKKLQRSACAIEPDTAPSVQAGVPAQIDKAEGRSRPMVGMERFDFSDRDRESYAVIQTGERRFRGCFIFRTGVIGPEE